MNIWKCENERHRCGMMMEHNASIPRCRAYFRDHKNVTERKTTYMTWHRIIKNAENNAKAATTYARPGNCIRDGKLVDSASSAEPYIAISYVWDPNPSFKEWEGRRVTEQALHIADRLSKYTSYALWIDAICIDQDNEPIKMVELAKMADIYRGAIAVLCLVPEIDQTISRVVEHGTGMIDLDGFRALEQAGDTHGMYMFASQGSNKALHRLFSSRWWTRVWTFQEAVLNRITFLVGENEETIPISDVLKISRPISRRAATQKKDNLLGQLSSFWDSVHSMSDAMKACMPLGAAISSVWRRQSTVTHDMAYSLLGVCRLETITPDYRLPVEKVFAELVDKASLKGDFSWLRWSHLVDRDAACEGMSMVPVPATVLATPASAITEWRSVEVPQMSVVRGGALGVRIPHRSTGVIRWQSQPEDIKGIINMLQKLSYCPEDIWNLLFGLHVGLGCDVDRAVGGSGLAQALLNLATGYIDGTIKLDDSVDDLVGEKPYTRGYGFTAYASMAAKVWRNAQLVVARSQGGTTVVPTHSGTGQARLHRLPVESPTRRGTCLCLVVNDSTKFRASAIGVMVENDHVGSGSWQLTRFS
ncbi:heterokaryon incompatibility protein-domain-containing protein [Suillus bovinus]|uniref:heterokaryon incompatibility protein-domain-containing protein n=1 Tax=Suillus bovinus TaxID=48563 RepID=UPI001B85C05C|nr:heterokaryon incompatibility protein-domain-containing protein [Suillus bovinus]KAG2144407.1 heterokaryon incompatibility protein-domain-containing protein [Suillus bovinus]